MKKRSQLVDADVCEAARENRPHEHRCIRCRIAVGCVQFFRGDHACKRCAGAFRQIGQIAAALGE